MCEGELKSFGAKFIKAKGKRVAVFKKGGCLGTSSLIGLNTSDEKSAQGLQWPASLPQVRPGPHVLPLTRTTLGDMSGYPCRALLSYVRLHLLRRFSTLAINRMWLSFSCMESSVEM